MDSPKGSGLPEPKSFQFHLKCNYILSEDRRIPTEIPF